MTPPKLRSETVRYGLYTRVNFHETFPPGGVHTRRHETTEHTTRRTHDTRTHERRNTTTHRHDNGGRREEGHHSFKGDQFLGNQEEDNRRGMEMTGDE